MSDHTSPITASMPRREALRPFRKTPCSASFGPEPAWCRELNGHFWQAWIADGAKPKPQRPLGLLVESHRASCLSTSPWARRWVATVEWSFWWVHPLGGSSLRQWTLLSLLCVFESFLFSFRSKPKAMTYNHLVLNRFEMFEPFGWLEMKGKSSL